jgi:hypothetical protein
MWKMKVENPCGKRKEENTYIKLQKPFALQTIW